MRLPTVRLVSLLLFLVAVPIALAGTVPRAVRSSWTVVDIGQLTGTPTSRGEGISNSGFAVGMLLVRDDVNQLPDQTRGFVYRDGFVEVLGTGTSATIGNSRATAVNNAGDATGSSDAGEVVVWNRDGSVVSLGIPGTGLAINDAGVVAGDYVTGSHARAFVYDHGRFIDVGTFGGEDSHASAINGRGDVVGYATTADGTHHAFLFTNGELFDLGNLGGPWTEANDVNDAGEVVGSTGTGSGVVGFLWRGGAMQPLPGLAAAVGINNRAQVVGIDSHARGAVWENGVITLLHTLPAVVEHGWGGRYGYLMPWRINDRGWIVGTVSEVVSRPQAFVLIPDAAAR